MVSNIYKSKNELMKELDITTKTEIVYANLKDNAKTAKGYYETKLKDYRPFFETALRGCNYLHSTSLVISLDLWKLYVPNMIFNLQR